MHKSVSRGFVVETGEHTSQAKNFNLRVITMSQETVKVVVLGSGGVGKSALTGMMLVYSCFYC